MVKMGSPISRHPNMGYDDDTMDMRFCLVFGDDMMIYPSIRTKHMQGYDGDIMGYIKQVKYT